MRVATFNVLHGRTVSDGVVDPQRLRDAVRRLDPDVLGLQEVDCDQPRSGRHDLTAVAAEAMGAVAARFVPAIVGTPGEQWRPARDGDVSGTAYGIALLSRIPVRSWHVVRLPSLRLRSPLMSPQRRLLMVKDEPRVAVAAVLQTTAGPMTVATTHLSFVPGWNVVQLRRLVASLRRLPAPQLLTGDLNIPGRLPRAVASWRRLADAPTFPAHDPAVQLDHVLALGAVEAVAEDAPQLGLSDHRAIVVDVRIADDH